MDPPICLVLHELVISKKNNYNKKNPDILVGARIEHKLLDCIPSEGLQHSFLISSK